MYHKWPRIFLTFNYLGTFWSRHINSCVCVWSVHLFLPLGCGSLRKGGVIFSAIMMLSKCWLNTFIFFSWQERNLSEHRLGCLAGKACEWAMGIGKKREELEICWTLSPEFYRIWCSEFRRETNLLVSDRTVLWDKNGHFYKLGGLKQQKSIYCRTFFFFWSGPFYCICYNIVSVLRLGFWAMRHMGS